MLSREREGDLSQAGDASDPLHLPTEYDPGIRASIISPTGPTEPSPAGWFDPLATMMYSPEAQVICLGTRGAAAAVAASASERTFVKTMAAVDEDLPQSQEVDANEGVCFKRVKSCCGVGRDRSVGEIDMFHLSHRTGDISLILYVPVHYYPQDDTPPTRLNVGTGTPSPKPSTINKEHPGSYCCTVTPH